MSTLQTELTRLYLCGASGSATSTAADSGLIPVDAGVRAMVLELARPADWTSMSAVWRGVQSDLALPAPAIAVSGVDGYQLWFSLTQPVPLAAAQAFLESLRVRYLGMAEPGRVGMLPWADASAHGGVRLARLVPARQPETGLWSAFVAPDLAAIFSEEPWLDVPPTPDAQARILSGLTRIEPAAFQAVLTQIGPATAVAPSNTPSPAGKSSSGPTTSGDSAGQYTGSAPDPRSFLVGVMNDPSVELALRIEAAKALLPCCEGRGG